MTDPYTAGATAVGAVAAAVATVKVARIQFGNAKPRPEAVRAEERPSTDEQRMEQWRRYNLQVVDRLIEAEVKIAQLTEADKHKARRIEADAEQIRRLTQRVASLVDYVRVLVAELTSLGRIPPRPPEGLDDL